MMFLLSITCGCGVIMLPIFPCCDFGLPLGTTKYTRGVHWIIPMTFSCFMCLAFTKVYWVLACTVPQSAFHVSITMDKQFLCTFGYAIIVIQCNSLTPYSTCRHRAKVPTFVHLATVVEHCHSNVYKVP